MAPDPERAIFLIDGEAIDAVRGYRTWRLDFVHGRARLRSVYAPEVWWEPGVPKTMTCLCRSPDPRSTIHEIPGACKGTCGIYAWANNVRPIDGKARAEDWMGHARFVHGEVYLWGNVKIHERGYRAQYAMPAAFHVRQCDDAMLRLRVEIASIQYDVPLVTT